MLLTCYNDGKMRIGWISWRNASYLEISQVGDDESNLAVKMKKFKPGNIDQVRSKDRRGGDGITLVQRVSRFVASRNSDFDCIFRL